MARRRIADRGLLPGELEVNVGPTASSTRSSGGSSRRYDRCGPQPSASATNRSALRRASPTTRKSSSTTSARVVTKIRSNGGGPNGDFWGVLVVAATYRAEHRSSAGEPRMPVRAERAFQIVHAAAQCRRPDQLACRSRGSGPAGREGLPIGDQLRLAGPPAACAAVLLRLSTYSRRLNRSR